ncbi:sec-independent protein translocase protein TatA [Thalassospira sp. MBR-102]|jgi:sec-independent protein translocase protein TatA|uniref:Sec-independent protein translocase protein TatA n=5 Tax=Thalassospira TaxID=168934 RepID=A0A154V6V6_9PROT|nr:MULTISPECIES: twin-arginine translocase TatA/TatE family subunit [Thalassospira]MBR9778917.1 twin-arginine translocase TatA/TatE family subunit [Rhodospirillales bacterium]UKV16503.1 twin-arginine translocase TatA/TatE family subunit [Thalassospiraceae bacterium SW-3-3]AJD52016.1 twin-arginine translocation protein, TatA/E family subunit [Thalassospira xiamenensis M-5 = DSM 17429]KEO50609.1 preprotein translocase subunit TatA [Thalassospira permensis NBRC 106175]KZB53876.1 preprotein transl|tara:strand:- start:347 stop:577 length:231 start_codon:yes stop_codon:yes gene_type:complete
MGIGVWQIVLILAIVLIIFGAGKLPKVMGDMGKGIKSFKAGINEKDEDSAASAKTIENNTSASVSAESKDKDSVKS